MLRRRRRRRLEAQGRLGSRTAHPSRRPFHGLLRMRTRLLKSIYNATFLGEIPMQLGPQSSQNSTSKKWDWMIPVAMLTASAAAFIASLSFAVFSVETWTAMRDADLVKIG